MVRANTRPLALKNIKLSPECDRRIHCPFLHMYIRAPPPEEDPPRIPPCVCSCHVRAGHGGYDIYYVLGV